MSMEAALIFSSATWSSARRRPAAMSRMPLPDDTAEAGDADIVADRLFGDQAVAAVLSHQAETEGDRLVRARD